jgi:cytochrome P450
MHGFEKTEDYQLFCEERLQNPYPLFARMRTEDPVHWSSQMKLWLMTRYDDVFVALRDKRLSASRQAMYEQALPEEMKRQVAPLLEHLKNWLIFLDPPEHTHLRRLINTAFTPKMLEYLRPRVQQIAEENLAAIPTGQPFDLKRSFSLPLSATVICEMLGIPPENRDEFQRANETLVSFSVRGGPKLRETALEANDALLRLTALFTPLMEVRRKSPQADLISALVRADVVGEELDDAVVLAFCVFLFLAGHEATTSSITSGLLLLLANPAEHERLLEDPESLLPTFIEEVFRYESAAFRAVRQAAEDIELRGKIIKKGEPVILLLGAANRDPQQFADPDRFDLGRNPNRHVAFGLGIHYCLGAPLARIEMDIAFRALLNQMPRPRLVDENIHWRPLMGVRSMAELILQK